MNRIHEKTELHNGHEKDEAYMGSTMKQISLKSIVV